MARSITNKYKLMRQSKTDLLRLLYSYQKLVDMNFICSATDFQGNIIYVNAKFCAVSGFNEEELIGNNHRIVNSGFHTKDFFKNLWDTVKKGKIWQGEVKNKRKNGTYFWTNSTVLPVFDNTGNIIQFFSLRCLIDEKKKAEEEKKENIRSLEEMLFITSHKVRQPIANILGLTNHIEKEINSPEDLQKTISYMKESAVLLDNFTNELTKFIYGLTQRKEQE